MSDPWGQTPYSGSAPDQPGQPYPGQYGQYGGQYGYPDQYGPYGQYGQPGQYGQQAPYTGQPNFGSFGTPAQGYGPPRPPSPGNRGLWITLSIVAVVVVLLIVAAFLVLPNMFSKKSNTAGGSPASGSSPSSQQVAAGIPAPPNTPIPARSSTYNTFPPACSLLSGATNQLLNPGGTSKDEPPADLDEGDFKEYQHDCTFESREDNLRVMSLSLSGTVGDDAVDETTSTYQSEDITETSPFANVTGQRTVSGLGDEAKLVYGQQDVEKCNVARVYLRTQNAIIDASFGGCDKQPGTSFGLVPLSQADAQNGALTMAREALQHFNSVNP